MKNRRKPNKKHVNPAEEFDCFFAQYQALVGRISNNRVNKNINWNIELSGLKKIFASFDSIVPVKTPSDQCAIIEWNPLNQRLLYDQLSQDKMALTYSFSEIFKTVGEFITSSHEAMHVLVLESFFCGRYNFKSDQKLQELYLLFEGFSFWFADIVLTPKLRTRMPDNEILFKNSAVSSRLFHPSQALMAAGVKTIEEALDLYLKAFSGEKTAIYKSEDIFSLNLQQRISQFYFENLKPLKLLFKILKEAQIFSEFVQRFTQVPNLPSLLSEQTLKINLDQNPERYIKNIYEMDLPQIEMMSEERIHAVRLRRRIQTRAYYAYCLQFILKKTPMPKIGEKLEIYISLLEKTLQVYLISGHLDICDNEIRKADTFYEKNVRSVFTNKNIWVLDRQILLKMNWDKSQTVRFHQLKKYENVDPKIDSLLWVITETLKQKSDLIIKLLEPLSLLHKAKMTESLSQKRNLYNRALLMPSVLPLWTVRLDSFNPIDNQFRELLFSYE